MLFAVLW